MAEGSKTKNKKKNFQKKGKAPDNKPKDMKQTKKFNGEFWFVEKSDMPLEIANTKRNATKRQI